MSSLSRLDIIKLRVENYRNAPADAREDQADLLLCTGADDLAWLLDQLEATQARAAAAEARLERAKRGLRVEQMPNGTYGPVAEIDARPFAERFPETDEHRSINDEAAALALAEDALTRALRVHATPPDA